VAESYVSAVQRTGSIALILPIDARAPEALLERIDGLMLIGGADIDPASYGEARDPATEATYPERDAFELALMRGAIEREMPVLGICRGMQLINVAFGGTLIQDLTGPDGSNAHRKSLGSFDGTDHEVELDPGSLVSTACAEQLHVARCHHHQGVDRVGEGLTVSGRAVIDGLPEAIEASDGRWLLGVQWHPEADERSRLFGDFANAARSRAGSWTKGPDLTPCPEPAI
jgi:putative glutamine amidotransferase